MVVMVTSVMMYTSAGASVNDFMFAYLLHASVILMVQVIILLVVVFAIFRVSCYHGDSVYILSTHYRLRWRVMYFFMV